MIYLSSFLVLLCSYLIGSIPFGYLVARRYGVDIFKVGSANPGATNVKRCVGKGAGNFVFLLDFLKGLVSCGWIYLMPESALGESAASLGILGIVGAVLGHSFSVFTRFRGGKGVSTVLGGVVALIPLTALIGALVWMILFYATRYVSVASIGLAISLPISQFFFPPMDVRFWFALILAVFVTYRHRENIQRLLKGKENRFTDDSSK
ncbi:MAG: glycerol-3-phosphate 1-O-acyltransferase PlsY [Opitutaceae bacterium]|nr:glycerol-3-phosphate 1-O-acyltransferase PlsY [Opitutaceae bacterium]